MGNVEVLDSGINRKWLKLMGDKYLESRMMLDPCVKRFVEKNANAHLLIDDFLFKRAMEKGMLKPDPGGNLVKVLLLSTETRKEIPVLLLRYSNELESDLREMGIEYERFTWKGRSK